MDTDTVTVPEQEPEQVQNDVQENIQEAPVNDTEAFDNAEVQEETKEHVPLAALQKERRKRQDVEAELKLYRENQLKQMQQQQPQEEDESQYEPLTRAEFKKQMQFEMRASEEKSWIRQNPEKTEVVNEELTNFLKQRPNLAAAIEAAPNRYEEAWELMDKLSPKQKAALKSPQATKREAPNSPSGIPKAAAMNQSVDVMNMTDPEYLAWRKSKRSSRR